MLTLRPCDDFRFATNRFHDTWHIISDWRGAKALSHLLWGLAYQSKPGTIVLIDPPSLEPNPFDAEPSEPIVLMNSPVTGFDDAAARALKRQLPWRGQPEGTVRWQVFGLPAAVQARVSEWEKPWSEWAYNPDLSSRETVRHRGGMIVYAGGTGALRTTAIAARLMTRHSWRGSNYLYLAGRDGEIQIFRQFRSEVSIAKQARAEVLASATRHQDLQWAIWAHAETVRRRRLPAPPSELAASPRPPAEMSPYNTFVECPRCQGRARMCSPDQSNTFRLVCPECTLVRSKHAVRQRLEPTGIDPVFGLRLLR